MFSVKKEFFFVVWEQFTKRVSHVGVSHKRIARVLQVTKGACDGKNGGLSSKLQKIRITKGVCDVEKK